MEEVSWLRRGMMCRRAMWVYFGVLCVPPGVRLGWRGIVVVLESVWVEEELSR